MYARWPTKRYIIRKAALTSSTDKILTMTTINELTLDELADRLEAERDSASPRNFEAWKVLTDLARSLSKDAHDDTLVRGRRWMLKSLSVRGFRGAAEAITVDFDAHPSLTVLHGENGTGKSSIAEAIRVAISGTIGAAHLGATKNDGLWNSENYRSRGAQESRAVVTLVDDHDPSCQLTITTVESDTGIDRTAELIHNGQPSHLDSASPKWPAWDHAVRTNPPVLAYAELFNELRTKKELHTWLTRCLSIDVATKMFDNAVADAQAEAKSANDRIIKARQRAKEQVEAADTRATDDGVGGITSISWEDFFDERSLKEWLERHHLEPKIRNQVRLPSNQLDLLKEYSLKFKELLNDFNDSAAAELTPTVVAQLIQLDGALTNQPQTSHCPVCGSLGDWRTHLHDQMPDFQATRRATQSLRAHCRERMAKLVEPLQKIITVLPAKSNDKSMRDVKLELTENLARLNADDLDPSVLVALESLCDWVTSQEGMQLITIAIASADRHYEWQLARWEALEPYLETWSHERATASTANTWSTARRRWNSHLQYLRNDRSRKFADLVAPKVAALLADVGLRVKSLDVLKTNSTLSIVDKAGLDIELNYLSAGQRNALILGPVLVAAEGGLFGFTILDDPVHSFDEFRVDQLAEAITSIAENQALIIATHDGRFVDYLRVHASTTFNVFHTSRSVDGQIALEATDSPWLTVLDHADYLLSKGTAGGISDSGIGDIQSLLRMAADSAVESLFLRLNSEKPSDERAESRTTFYAAMTTKNRITHIAGTIDRKDPNRATFDKARNHVDKHLDDWNDAAHGVPAGTPPELLLDQITDARRFCLEIDQIGR